jgi:hypothetical protein
MRRIIVAALLILAISSIPLFSVEESFTVTSDVALIGYMKVSALEILGNTVSAYNGSGEFTTHNVTTSGDQGLTAFMTTLCNSRTGYRVSMSATPMTSAVEGAMTGHINYTVSCNGVDVFTTLSSETVPPTILTVPSLMHLTGRSDAITLTVDATTFDAAVAGSYTGTVTFIFTAT